MTWMRSKSTRMQPAMAPLPCPWSLEVENTVNTLHEGGETVSGIIVKRGNA
jgi:hypothetical protein